MAAAAAPPPDVAPSSSDDILAGLPRFYSASADPLYNQEFALMHIGGVIRNKLNWVRKVRDPAILNKWMAEIEERYGELYTNYLVGEQQFWAGKFPGPLAPAAVPGTYLADDGIPEDVVAELRGVVERLETEGEKDWHPGSEGQVLDLVHPSLYPLVFGTTLALPPGHPPLSLHSSLSSIGASTLSPVPRPLNYTPSRSSKNFQWLPALFEVSPDGSVHIRSYVNNLHPRKFRSAYPVLERIFAHFLPLFEAVLTDLLNPRPPVFKVDPYTWYGDDDEPREGRWPRPLPLPEAFTPPPEPAKIVNLRGKTLQVIVKLANIHLTPEKPSYPGGAWHIEGMENESIVATGILYHSQENITESALEFRAAVRDDFEYEQDDREGVSVMYHIDDGQPLNQHLGSATSLPGRCLCFPNTLQHRVKPFQLEDRARPGHRKILVFWLVDPCRPMAYTSANVPPQQLEWFKDEVFREGSKDVPNRESFPLSDVPEGARGMVEEKVEAGSLCPYPLGKAKDYREELMKERKFFVGEQNEEFYERPLSLCEH